MIHESILNFIASLDISTIKEERKEQLLVLVNYLQQKVDNNETIQLNFVCTHNSRRSHLAQVWAQTMAVYFDMSVTCYSAGTEATRVYKGIIDTLSETGFECTTLAEQNNAIYAARYAKTMHPVILFSKTINHSFNPEEGFAAIMTCSQADEGCPFVPGAYARFAITYEDPKVFDNTKQEKAMYAERSLQIATECYYIFSSVNKPVR